MKFSILATMGALAAAITAAPTLESQYSSPRLDAIRCCLTVHPLKRIPVTIDLLNFETAFSAVYLARRAKAPPPKKSPPSSATSSMPMSRS